MLPDRNEEAKAKERDNRTDLKKDNPVSSCSSSFSCSSSSSIVHNIGCELVNLRQRRPIAPTAVACSSSSFSSSSSSSSLDNENEQAKTMSRLKEKALPPDVTLDIRSENEPSERRNESVHHNDLNSGINIAETDSSFSSSASSSSMMTYSNDSSGNSVSVGVEESEYAKESLCQLAVFHCQQSQRLRQFQPQNFPDIELYCILSTFPFCSLLISLSPLFFFIHHSRVRVCFVSCSGFCF